MQYMCINVCVYLWLLFVRIRTCFLAHTKSSLLPNTTQYTPSLYYVIYYVIPHS